MKLHVVAKAPVDMGDAYEIVGAFTRIDLARAAVARGGRGIYLIAHVDHDRAYRTGELLDVDFTMKVSTGI